MPSLALALALAAPAAAQDYPVYNPRYTPEVEVVRKVAPAVVFVQSYHQVRDLFGRRRPQQQVITGSGVVIERSGYIVTNHHVVGYEPQRITVQFDPDHDPNLYEAEVVSFAQADDLALLKIRGERDFPVVLRGTSSDLMIGERVLAIGNPFGQKLTVSAGIISGLHRDLTVQTGSVPLRFSDLIQTDASINPGNSGGPLLNILGELVGISTAVNAGAENMGFAIPIDRVEEVLHDDLLAPSASRAWLGFEVDEGGDLCVLSVVPASPADLEGLQEGERLVAIDGVELKGADDYRLRRIALVPNQPVVLRVAGADGERNMVLRGWERVDGTLYERLGMTVETIVIGHRGWVRVKRLAPGGPAERLGLEAGDVVDAVRVLSTGHTWRIPSPDAFSSLVAGLAPGTRIEIDVLRDEDGNRRLELDEMYKGELVVE